MRIIPDASVLVPIFIEETNSDACHHVLTQVQDRIFLDFTLIEVSNTLRSAALRGRISSERALASQADLVAMTGHPIHTALHLNDAFILALAINHSVYDCLHAVAARALDATLVTCDHRFASKLDNTLYRVNVI